MENYTQLCVWPGATLGDQTPQEFEEFVLEMMGTRVRYHDTVETLPDLENGNPVPETGGRSDLFFYVHTDDIPHFSVPRLKIGIRWWEDVIVYNDNRHLYTKEFIRNHPPTW